MTRDELEHIIRASADVTREYEFVIVGSQSILGPVPNPDGVFTVSAEADIYPMNAPELADKIEGALGEGSRFHETYGYYAQGVGPETAILPSDWFTRVHRVQNTNTNGRVAYCLGVADLFMSKAAAGRDKDREFCLALLERVYVTPAQVLALVPRMPMDHAGQSTLRATIRRWVRALRASGHAIPEE